MHPQALPSEIAANRPEGTGRGKRSERGPVEPPRDGGPMNADQVPQLDRSLTEAQTELAGQEAEEPLHDRFGPDASPRSPI